MASGVDVNAAGRLHPVVSIEDSRAGPAIMRAASEIAPLPESDGRQQLEQLCARAERQGTVDAWAQASPLIHSRLRDAPGDAQAWIFLAKSHMVKGRDGHNEALQAAHEALRLEPGIALGFMLDDLIARRSLKAREWDIAVRHGEAALASRPNDPECLEIVARACFHQDRIDRAESAISTLANVAPDRSAKLSCSFAEESKTPQQKHQWLTRAAAWGRGRERPLRQLGQVCLALGRTDEAMQWFQKAIAQDSEDIESINALAQLHVRAGTMEEALEVYRAGSRALPDNYAVHRRFGELLLQERRAAEAVDVIRRAARLAPPADSSGLYVALADLQGSMGLHSEALRAWEAAVALDEGSVPAWRGLAAAAVVEKNERAQLRALSQLCRVDPSNSEWPAKLQQLRESQPEAPVVSRGEPSSPPVARSTQAPRPGPPNEKNDAAPAKAPSSIVPSKDWREAIVEAQDLEVYSKSANKWLSSKVVQVSSDMVKLKYLIDGHWCEKVLLRSSEMLRPKTETAEEPPSEPAKREAAAFAPPPRPEPQPQPQPPAVASAGPPMAVAPSSRSIAAPPPQAVQQSPQQARGWSTPTPAEENNRRGWGASPAAATPTASASSPAGEDHRNQGIPPAAATPSVTPCNPVEEDPPRRQWTSSPTPPAPAPQKPKPSATPSHPELLEPQELQFGQVLGSGGFGAVYRGKYRGEEVAIKKLHPMDGKISSSQLEEFKKEVANLQALRHQRLVSFIGAAYVAPSLCLVLEFMSNGSLYDLLHQRRQRLSPQERWNMATQISEGVGFLHGRQPPFVHRDLKSLNVVLDKMLNCKLCDFGLTQSMEKTHISRKENEGGSPRYMAPELFDSKGRITEKVDVWALGCLAVEVFSSRVPHEECNTIQMVMMKTLVDRKLPFLDWTGIHPELQSLAELCFVFDPRDRVDAARFLEGLMGLQRFL